MIDHFGRVCYVVAFQILFRYVFEFSFMNGSSFEPILGLFWFQIRFRYVFEFSFMNGASLEPILGSFWSRMLRGCVPNLVS